jgi:hypothetical protein
LGIERAFGSWQLKKISRADRVIRTAFYLGR